MTTNNPKESLIKYTCDKCNYLTCNKKDFNKHLMTRKHKNTTKYNENEIKIPSKTFFTCNCGKIYPYRASLYNHKKKCTFLKENQEKEENQENTIIDKDDKDLNYKDMFLTMINENKELRKVITELIPNVGNNNNSHNTINNKQRFNINVFLNEQCKDALTMNQFMDQIKITIEDLMYTKDKGISAGVSNLFIKNMNKLSLYERPIHCTDTKRETVYIKSDGEEGDSNGQWEKDTEKEKLKKAISTMTFVQSKNLKLYTEANPDWMDKQDKQDEYVLMMRECMDDIKKDNRTDKVVKKLCNSVYINGDEVK